MKKYHIKNNAMNESELRRIYNYTIYPRDSEIYSNERFVNIYNGSQGGTHWTCFIVNKINPNNMTVSEALRIDFF